MDIKINLMDFYWLVKAIDKMVTEKIITLPERNAMIADIVTEQNLPIIYL